MKKMMFTLAMVMGLGTTVAFANNAYTAEDEKATVTQVADEFTPVEVKDLPQAVQESLAKNFPGATIKAAAVSTDEATQTATYKVTLEDAEGNESTVLLSDKGDVLQ